MKKVLAVDDSPSIRKLVEFSLKSKGIQAISVSDGLEAMETLARGPVDLMILDINMPRMDGFDLLRRMRADQQYLNIPVIMLTTEGEEEDKEKALALGANQYLVKPFKPTELISVVEKVLKV